MSANNYLKIYKKNLLWIVEERDAENHKELSTLFDEYASLEDAVKAANEYMEIEEIEYGIRIEV